MTRGFVHSLLGSILVAAVSIDAAWAGAVPIAVPEPSSLALIAIGVGGVAWLKFRNRK